MFASLKQRFGGPAAASSTLQADLKRVTESAVIEVPQELVAVIVEASQQGEEERRTIMGHLRECLSESTVKRWKRIHAALILIEALLQRGSPEIIYETAEGRHFDLVQRLSLLEHFENTSDKRVQNMIRTKATALRAEVVPRLETAGDAGERPTKKENMTPSDTASTCSPSVAPSLSSATSSCFRSEDCSKLPERPQGLMILNGVVAVGHRDDTTSESSGGENSKKAVAYKVHIRRTARERDSQATVGSSPFSAAVAAPKAASGGMDLLGL